MNLTPLLFPRMTLDCFASSFGKRSHKKPPETLLLSVPSNIFTLETSMFLALQCSHILIAIHAEWTHSVIRPYFIFIILKRHVGSVFNLYRTHIYWSKMSGWIDVSNVGTSKQ